LYKAGVTFNTFNRFDFYESYSDSQIAAAKQVCFAAYHPKKIETNKHRIEAAARIGIFPSHTVTSCKELCLETANCVEFALGIAGASLN
jgi:hypothetical protein